MVQPVSYTVRRMVVEDLPEISEKARRELDEEFAIQKDVFSEAFETDPTENLVLETTDGKMAGFAFCGITHEKDARHGITVGYIGYTFGPTVFGEHASPENKMMLWEKTLDSLGKRKVDAVRLSYGVSKSSAKVDEEELTRKLGFVEWKKDGSGSDTFYTDLELPLSNWEERQPNPEYKIRRIVDGDIENVVEILDVGFNPMEPGNRQHDGVRARMRNGWVCELDDKVVGCCFAQPYENKNLVELRGLAVHPDYRNRGIATEMVKRVLNHSKAAGRELAMAGARNDNTVMHGVLKNMGFYEKCAPDGGPFRILYKEMRGSS